MINAPHALLRFILFEGWVYYMDTPEYDNLISADVDFTVPIIQAQGLYAGIGGVRVGYRFRCPLGITKVAVNYIMVSREEANDWEPSYGLPGFQVYTCVNGVCLISTRVTQFLRTLQ